VISRRDFVRISGASGAGLLFAHALGGCAEEMAPALPTDPEGRWWLSGNYAPVPDEIEAFDLEVQGSLPPELDGLLVRNGSNPATGESAHWFTGDGMLHGIRLSGGRALWYRNRFVETLAWRTDMADNLAANRANTSIKAHAGKLLALYEAGLPHEIVPDDLSTAGEHDFDGALRRPMSAHPKLDPVSGEMFFTSYSPGTPFVTYHVVDASGALTTTVEVEIEHASMMHDFQITESHALLFDFPIHFDFDALSMGFPFRWVPHAPSRIGVLPRDGSSGAPTWIDVEQCFMFHSFNAFEQDGRIVLEGCRLPSLWVDGIHDASDTPQPWRWELDPENRTVSEDGMIDGRADFPQIDPRRAGRSHRISYALRFAEDTADAGFAAPDGVLRYDRSTSEMQVWDAGGDQPDEALFVPFGDAEDAGYLLSVVFERATRRSYLAVLDATDVTAGPVARVRLPRRVPFGFHGTWLPMG